MPEVVAISPVASPAAFYHNGDLAQGARARESAKRFTGGSPEELPDAYAAIEPSLLAKPESLPTSIVLGDHDYFIPPEGSYELATHLEGLGVDTELIAVK